MAGAAGLGGASVGTRPGRTVAAAGGTGAVRFSEGVCTGRGGGWPGVAVVPTCMGPLCGCDPVTRAGLNLPGTGGTGCPCIPGKGWPSVLLLDLCAGMLGVVGGV